MNEIDHFQNAHYLRHNQRRQEHLATLGLELSRKTVLEVGAGIGDHTSFFLDRNCIVTCTEGRSALIDLLQQRHPSVNTILWDVERSAPPSLILHQITYCYGLLYHVSDPDALLNGLADLTTELLLLETCVSFGDQELINSVGENKDDPTQALSGIGCRPTRPWLFSTLKKLFNHVYVTKTQPWHPEFPLDWREAGNPSAALSRSVFVASRSALDIHTLSEQLLTEQRRC